MKRVVWAVLIFLEVGTMLGGCHAPAPAVVLEPAPPRATLGLGRPPDRRFIYVVQPDGVYATARASDTDGKPVFSRKRIKVASIQPALDPGDQRVVDRDGDLVPTRGGATASGASVTRTVTVLISDPARAAELDAGPRTKDEFLALDDRTLVEYASAWLRYRDGAGFSQAERDVMLASTAFLLVAGDGFSGLLAMREDDLPAMRDGLRRMALDPFAEVIESARQLALAGQQSESQKLDQAWKSLADDPVPHLAAYIRAHADEFDWGKMRR